MLRPITQAQPQLCSCISGVLRRATSYGGLARNSLISRVTQSFRVIDERNNAACIVILPMFAFLSSLTGCSFHVWRAFSVTLKAGFIKGSCVNDAVGARCQILSRLISEARVSRLSRQEGVSAI